jgi:lysophospholipase L1-like esterase
MKSKLFTFFIIAMMLCSLVTPAVAANSKEITVEKVTKLEIKEASKEKVTVKEFTSTATGDSKVKSKDISLKTEKLGKSLKISSTTKTKTKSVDSHDILIPVADIQNFNGHSVRITHFTDDEIQDNEYIQEVTVQDGYVLIPNVEFSSIIVDGFTGTYTRLIYDLNLSTVQSISQESGNVTSASVSIPGADYNGAFPLIVTGNTSVAPYRPIVYTDGSINWGVAGLRDFVSTGQQQRIRQTGKIEYIQFYVENPSKMSEFYFTVWRDNGTNYDKIYTSDNLIPLSDWAYLKTNTAYINVDVQEGDYYGYSINASGTSVHAVLNSGETRYTNSILDDTVINQSLSGFTTSTAVYPIDIYMESPDFIAIGDSITQGAPAHTSYLMTTVESNPETTYEYQLGELSNWSYQNMGIGGQTTTQIKSRFYADAINHTPGFIILLAGVNDVAGGATNETILSNVEWMLSEAQNNSVQLVLLSILPWSNGSEAQMQQIDYLNSEYETLANQYGAEWLDVRDDIGVDRAGYYTGNNWDINTSYNADGVHLNSVGNGVLAQTIYDELGALSGTVARTLPNGTWTAVEDGSATLPTDDTVSSIEVVGDGTYDVTTTTSFTEDTTLISESESNGILDISIYKEYVNNATSGYLEYEPVTTNFTHNLSMISDDPNATAITHNQIINVSTGEHSSGDSFYYNFTLSTLESFEYTVNWISKSATKAVVEYNSSNSNVENDFYLEDMSASSTFDLKYSNNTIISNVTSDSSGYLQFEDQYLINGTYTVEKQTSAVSFVAVVFTGLSFVGLYFANRFRRR